MIYPPVRQIPVGGDSTLFLVGLAMYTEGKKAKKKRARALLLRHPSTICGGTFKSLLMRVKRKFLGCACDISCVVRVRFPKKKGRKIKMGTILHITFEEAWKEAQAKGVYSADSLATEGFIHCSENDEQATFAANLFYKEHSGLPVLVIDTKKLQSEIKREACDGKLFPHVYGPINTDSVVDVRTLIKLKDGSFAIK
ncbi:hypothetical protein BSKO_12790 [Bryopsis sp. KO-2023]|nr:hypothetical protein BSKO_12790 [Bryopsis sp. KO-2023]